MLIKAVASVSSTPGRELPLPVMDFGRADTARQEGVASGGNYTGAPYMQEFTKLDMNGIISLLCHGTL